jgi:sarcosine oxidase
MAAVKALLPRGIDVRCFERGEPGGGQSAGTTRLFRHTHDSDPLVLLALSARNAWKKWEDELGRRLIGDEGVLQFAGDLDHKAARLSAAAVPFELLDPAGQAAVLPGLRSPAERAIFEQAGGAIRARRTISFLSGLVGSSLVRTEVLGIEQAPGNGYRLLVGDGLWRCQRVVLCAGVETSRLAAQLGIDIPVILRWHLRASFALREHAQGSRTACLQDLSGGHGESVYGSPAGRSGQYALGLLGPTSDTPFDATTRAAPRGLSAGPLLERIVRYVDVALRALQSQPAAVRICPTTKLQQGKDAFGVWCERGLTAIAGNNLYKFAPILGEHLAEASVSGHLPGPLHDVVDTFAVGAP